MSPVATLPPVQPPQRQWVKPSKPSLIDNFESFVRVRGSLDPTQEAVYYWTGSIHAQEPEKPARHLFDFEGFNIARTVIDAQGNCQLLTREMAVYRDPETHEILKTWENPYSGKRVNVLPVWNDPVNNLLPNQGGLSPVAVTDLGDKASYSIDAFLSYPSPLPRQTYAAYSQSDTYQGAELFNFYVDKEDLANPALPSVPSQISWTRLGPWLPWMQMADRPGQMVYHARGAKLEDGVKDLPQDLRDFVSGQQPKYLSAPERWSRPNETSWTYFKKQIDSGSYQANPPQEKELS